jgi:hypothetical protein
MHEEGCRIFAVHALTAMHDYQPYLASSFDDRYPLTPRE